MRSALATIARQLPPHLPRLPSGCEREHHQHRIGLVGNSPIVINRGLQIWARSESPLMRSTTRREDEMRNRVTIVVLGLAASAVFAAAVQLQPLSVKTGLWHLTKSVTWTNLPPQMAA